MHKKLAKFLASDKRPEGTMTLPEVYGFFFTVCCAPEPVTTEEWMPVVFNAEDANYKSEEKQAKIEASLLEVFEEVKAQVDSDEPQLPEWCEILEPAVENFSDEADLAFWADGVFDGADWLSDVWDSHLDDESEEAYNDALRSLVYFSHREDAAEISGRAEDQLVSEEQLAEAVVKELSSAIVTYARMGKTLAQAHANKQPYVKEIRLGRNDPCFCGSGKKYKKCCMNL